MYKKLYLAPAVLIFTGLCNFIWSFIDYLGNSKGFENSLSMAILIPIGVYSIWSFWIVINARENLTILAQKLTPIVTILFVAICFVALIIQSTLATPFQEIARYFLYCLVSGYVISLGCIKYYSSRKHLVN